MPHLFARLRLANLVHREPDVDQHPVADGDVLTLEQADIHPPAHAAHVHRREVRSGGVKLDDLSGNRQTHVRLLRPPVAARATMSNDELDLVLELERPAGNRDRLDAVVALPHHELPVRREPVAHAR